VPDPLSSIVHSEEQGDFLELREKFREENRQRIHKMLREDEITLRATDGTVVARKKTGYLTDAPPGHEHRRVDDWKLAGGSVPAFTNTFEIPDSPGLRKELRDLDRDVTALAESERVKHSGVSESAPPLASLSDAAVVSYMDNVLKETNGSEACSDDNGDSEASGTSVASGAKGSSDGS